MQHAARRGPKGFAADRCLLMAAGRGQNSHRGTTVPWGGGGGSELEAPLTCPGESFTRRAGDDWDRRVDGILLSKA